MAILVERAFFSDRETRALAVAVVGSVLLHAALLLFLPALREAQQRRETREPMVARLVEPPKPAPLASIPSSVSTEPKEPVAIPTAKSASEARKPAAARSAESVRPPLKPAPRPAEAAPLTAQPAIPWTETAAAAQAIPPREAPASATISSQKVEAAPAPASRSSTFQAQPSPAGSEAPDAGTLAQYRLAVISAARRYKRYPRLALENDWQGKVEIRMAISADGSISSLSVRSSAGHALLDQQALEMIERAKALAQIPPALRGKPFVVDIPVEFLLREPGA